MPTKRNFRRIAAAALLCFALPVIVPSQEGLNVAGIASVSPLPGAVNVPLDGAFHIRLTATSYFGYVDGNKFRVFDAETGEQMGPDIQFKPGDPQEQKQEIVIPFSQFSLLAGSTYYATADGSWTRINAEPWNVGAIPPKSWTFTTAGERPRLTRPDAFSFEDRRDVPAGLLVQSGAVLIEGINTAVPVTITGGEYSIDGGAFTAEAGSIRRRQTLRVRTRAATEPGAQVEARIQVGDAAVTFRVSTAPPDGLPTGFTFLEKINAAPASEHESEQVTIGGLAAPAPISITGGEYSIDGGPFTSDAAIIANGQTLKLRARAPEQYNHTAAAVIRIGDAEADFSVRTPVHDPAACREKSIGPDPTSVTGRRLPFNFPTVDGAKAGDTITSVCVTLAGVGPTPVSVTSPRALVSINNGPFSNSPGTVKDGDEIRARITASDVPGLKLEEEITFTGVTIATFSVRTRNNSRAPRVFHVGPNREFRELSAVSGQLVEGDTVEVDGDATYSPVIFRRPGSPDHPITIRGITVNGKRPLITGGTRTVQFEESNYYRFENFEVTGASQICVRLMGNEILLRDLWVHGCERHGILGADFYNGSNTLDRVEVSDAGGQRPGEFNLHIVYIATDRDRYPGSRLRIQHSYLHDIRGDAIKSRAERNEIYYNWLDTGTHPQSIYTMELSGYEEYLAYPRIDCDIVGNVLNHAMAYGVRFGGDGTGESRGRVRMVNNTFVQGPRFDQFTPIVRLFEAIDSVYFLNNVFVRAVDGGQQPFRLLRIDEIKWVSGRAKIAGHHNWLPAQTTLEGAAAAEWTRTIQGAANPGLNAIASNDTLDVSLQRDTPLWAAGAAADSSLPGYEIDNALTVIRYRPPAVQPAAGQLLPIRFRNIAAPLNIGAQ